MHDIKGVKLSSNMDQFAMPRWSIKANVIETVLFLHTDLSDLQTYRLKYEERLWRTEQPAPFLHSSKEPGI